MRAQGGRPRASSSSTMAPGAQVGQVEVQFRFAIGRVQGSGDGRPRSP